MKKIILALILAATTTLALAGHYCDTSRTQYDRNTCYKANVDLNSDALKIVYNSAMASPQLPAVNKAELKNKVAYFYDRINTVCRDNACVANSLDEVSAWIITYHQERTGKVLQLRKK